MQKTTIKLTTLAIGVTLASSGFATDSAQQNGKAPSAEMLLQKMDSNGDKQISPSEAQGPLKNDFSKVDSNSDGYISLAELQKGAGNPTNQTVTLTTITINGIDFKVSDAYQYFTWDTLPDDVDAERQPIQTFTNTDGKTHYYEAVYNKNGNLNWYQAAKLAESGGGYLVAITSEAENDFVFSLVDDEKFFWRFPKYVEGKSQADHHEISIGPFLGGYQPEGSAEPAGGWTWLSGEAMTYTNWAKNLDDGVIDKDPRPNDQPNDSGDGQNQRVMGFGEMNVPVATWGDYMDDVGTYGRDRLPGRAYGFVIEYDSNPNIKN